MPLWMIHSQKFCNSTKYETASRLSRYPFLLLFWIQTIFTVHTVPFLKDFFEVYLFLIYAIRFNDNPSNHVLPSVPTAPKLCNTVLSNCPGFLRWLSVTTTFPLGMVSDRLSYPIMSPNIVDAMAVLLLNKMVKSSCGPDVDVWMR